MDVRAELRSEVAPEVIMAVVRDLGRYPEWLDIVGSSDPVQGEDAWQIVLRAQLGPFRRSKSLRMVRVHQSADRVRFERRELDGRVHAPWVLEAVVASPRSTTAGRPADPADGDGGSNAGSVLQMHLHYGGSLWVPMLGGVLEDEIRRSRERLVAVALAER